MDGQCKQVVIKQGTIFFRTSYMMMWLVFSLSAINCRNSDKRDTIQRANEIVIVYKDSLPIALQVPRDRVKSVPSDSLQQWLTIHVQESHAPMLGEWKLQDDQLLFYPVLPFTRDLSYAWKFKGELMGTVTVHAGPGGAPATVQAIYPTSDTVPENLLKIYITFSEPMEQGDALKHMVMVKNGRDTVNDVFLDLQPELWNSANTILTVWLDPGRIKRDLQPNQERGIPLEEGNTYELHINSDWRTAKGNKLHSVFYKKFIVAKRDSIRPRYNDWKIIPPVAGTKDKLSILFYEHLDYQLLVHAFQIAGPQGTIVNGRFAPGEKETSLFFNPDKEWQSGNYILEMESRLEDLAGNNLNRLFDSEISKANTTTPSVTYRRSFRVQ